VRAPARQRPTGALPISMPLVEATTRDGDAFIVTVDGTVAEPGVAVDRADLMGALRSVASDLACPIRVEVQEQNGDRFTDVLTPTDDDSQPVMEEPAPAGDGFVPGEQIAVAVVVAHRTAKADGTADLALPSGLVTQQREIVLMGQSSGTLVVVDGQP